jgi:NAD(P)-dependent dehydrogenase (short-subunit alcohol dehydrogenase family)
MLMTSSADRVSRGNPAGRLAGKVALVTGAGSGQGQEAALLFAAAGAHVLASDISGDGLAATQAGAKTRGLAIETMIVDASSPEGVGDWVGSALRQHGRVDVLYNNGAGVHMAPFGEMTLHQWHETIRLELDVVFIPTKAVWQSMIENGGGSIINIASTSGMGAVEELGASAHAAGKGGVIAWTRQVAMEGAEYWIRVNSISPGPILTPGSRPFYDASPSFRRAFNGWPMLGRTGRPEDVAFAGLFLASDESSFITGANLVVDGGTTSKVGIMDRRAENA